MNGAMISDNLSKTLSDMKSFSYDLDHEWLKAIRDKAQEIVDICSEVVGPPPI